MILGLRSYQQELSRELHLVRDAFNSRFPPQPHSLLWFIFNAFLKADGENFEILKPAIKTLIEKYELKCNCAEKVV